VADAYVAATGITLHANTQPATYTEIASAASASGIGRRAIKQRRVFERVRAGKGITVRRYSDLMFWFAAQSCPVIPPRALWP
jgi:hypothetical protein